MLDGPSPQDHLLILGRKKHGKITPGVQRFFVINLNDKPGRNVVLFLRKSRKVGLQLCLVLMHWTVSREFVCNVCFSCESEDFQSKVF